MDHEMMRVRAALLKLKPLVKNFGTLAIDGESLIKSAANDLNWTIDDSSPLLVVEGRLPAQLANGVQAVAILDAPSQINLPGNFKAIASIPMKNFLTLNEVVGSFFSKFLPSSVLEPVTRFLRQTGISKVVGARLCGLKDRENSLEVLVRQGTAVTLSPAPADALRDACMSVCGVGHLPLFGANFASLATVLIAALVFWLFGSLPMVLTILAALLLATTLGVAFERWSAGYYLAEDAREVVLDEVAGMALTLFFLPYNPHWLWFFVAFLLFRFFDIFKFGVHWVEETNWLGTIVWDDLLAGLYAGLVLMVLGIIF